LRHEAATVFELSRVAELAGLPGETLTKLAREMERHELASGEELDPEDEVGLVLGGMLTGAGGVLRPGDRLTGPARALTPAAVATCPKDTYDRVVGVSG
jgi:hypothetical protein